MKRNISGGIRISRFSKLERGQITTETAALCDKVFAQHGNVPNILRTLAHQPQISPR